MLDYLLRRLFPKTTWAMYRRGWMESFVYNYDPTEDDN